jgi:DNA mismatch repair protein MutL
MSIKLLSESLISRIAAGEVVERPASVVKELVENSLDAGASEISVWVEGSGSNLIRVSDNGGGIPFEEMALAIESHATSKLQEESDLLKIATLGFRGEALSSIASVSKMELLSRTKDHETGSKLQLEGGTIGEPTMMGSPVGTTVEVHDLFYNIPARRKFLKSPSTELSHISDVINRMALSHSPVHFRLYHAGKTLSDFVVTSRLEDRLQQVLGPDVSGSMVPFTGSHGQVKISGYLSTAPTSFSNSRYLLSFVNQRFVRDKIITHAILQGYETLLMKGRYPAVVLFLTVPYGEVDVNVHPAKFEVRFRKQSEIHDAVVGAVRGGLKSEAKEPGFKTSPGVWPSPINVREGPVSYGTIFRDNLRLFRNDLFRSDTVETPSGAQGIRKGFFSSLNILGQLLGCYIVCQSQEGMALIDQHAAHERIAFEKMRLQIQQGKMERQDLLIPQVFELPFAEAAILGQWLDGLEHLGFTVEGFGGDSFAIKSVPALFPAGDYRDVMRRMIAELAEIGHSTELNQELEERLMTLACHNVIRANRSLTREEIYALLEELDGIEFATQCPHGRPVLVEFSQSQLERMFKRS